MRAPDRAHRGQHLLRFTERAAGTPTTVRGMTSRITLLAALTGGLVGGGIPAAMTYFASQREQKEHRQAQQWQDAEVLADVYRLLMDIDPARRGMSASSEDGVEDARWADIGQRLDDVRGRLLRQAGGHPSTQVQILARKLEADLSRAASNSRFQVSDVLRHRDTPEHLQLAHECHEAAVATADELDHAVKHAGGTSNPALPR
jgi:hypothetical protein